MTGGAAITTLVPHGIDRAAYPCVRTGPPVTASTVGVADSVDATSDGDGLGPRARVLILLENLPLQHDARVTRQCRALLKAAYDVTVICPGSDAPMPEGLEDVRVRTYRAREGVGIGAFALEYGWATAAMLRLTLSEFCSPHRFDLIQTCNPPDLLFLVAAPFRLVGRPFVFDHHDLVPDLFEVRYGKSQPTLDRAVRLVEWVSLHLANRVLATNESVRLVALTRGRKSPAHVSVVRNGPELSRFPDRAPRSGALREETEKTKVAVWVGTMGPYDGVDILIKAVAAAVGEHGRRDFHVVLVGDGESRPEVETLIDLLGVRRYVSLTGHVPQDDVIEHLKCADVGLAPDPPGRRADRATMMKIMEYMAAGLPVVAFEGRETRVSAGEAAIYVPVADPVMYAQAILRLLDDDAQRAELGAIGRRRVEESLSWDIQQSIYLDAIAEALTAGPNDRLIGRAALGLVGSLIGTALVRRLRVRGS